MAEFLRLIAFGAGTFCLGVGFTVGILFALASRHSDDSGEGIVGAIFILASFTAAFYFFLQAI